MIIFNNIIVEHFVEQIYCMGGVKSEQVITELVKFGLRIMYRDGYQAKEV